MSQVVLIYDLKQYDNYTKAHEVLKNLGFSPFVSSGNGTSRLPNTTVVKTTTMSVVDVRQQVYTSLTAAGLNPTHIFVADMQSWEAYSP